LLFLALQLIIRSVHPDHRILFENQKNYFSTAIKNSSCKERRIKLEKLRLWILSNKKAIEKAIYNDFKKPASETGLMDIKPVLWEIDFACRELKKWMRPESVPNSLALIGTRSEIIYEPMGVVLIIAPWNFPFNLTIGPLVSAIAAGNCVFIKPSELSPHTSALIESMVKELFDEREVLVCPGDHHVSEGLLKLPFNHIFFTGGPEVGKKVMKAAAENLSSVTLELGGMNPAVVDASADLKDTAQKLIFGKFMNSGQSCLSVNYVMADKEVYQKLIDALLLEFRKVYGLQKPKREWQELSRIINRKHFFRIKNLIRESIVLGAKEETGGEDNEQDNYIHPCLLSHVPLNAPVLNEEIFGPVMPLISYNTIDEALSYINMKERPLAMYVFSRNEKNIRHLLRETTAGTTCINDTTLQFVHPHLPFGGVNHSGMGKSHGHAGFLAFSNQRSVLRQRTGFTAFKLIYPPYTTLRKKLVDLAIKYL
jgi:aldehyde dehydrogenase (NAD+)